MLLLRIEWIASRFHDPYNRHVYDSRASIRSDSRERYASSPKAFKLQSVLNVGINKDTLKFYQDSSAALTLPVRRSCERRQLPHLDDSASRSRVIPSFLRMGLGWKKPANRWSKENCGTGFFSFLRMNMIYFFRLDGICMSLSASLACDDKHWRDTPNFLGISLLHSACGKTSALGHLLEKNSPWSVASINISLKSRSV